MTVLGSVVVAPFDMKSQGSGNMVARMSMHMPMTVALALATKSSAEVVLELNMIGGATVSLFSAKVHPAFKEETMCGFAMQMTGAMKNGPPMCASSIEELRGNIPSIDADATLGFKFGLSQARLDRMQGLLDGSCALAIVLSAGLALCLSVPACVILLRQRRACSSDGSDSAGAVRDVEA